MNEFKSASNTDEIKKNHGNLVKCNIYNEEITGKLFFVNKIQAYICNNTCDDGGGDNGIPTTFGYEYAYEFNPVEYINDGESADVEDLEILRNPKVMTRTKTVPEQFDELVNKIDEQVRIKINGLTLENVYPKLNELLKLITSFEVPAQEKIVKNKKETV